jgi:MGT family glycosyltransferase
MTRFVVYTPLATGHVFPLVPGLTELHGRGHEVVVVTDPKLVPVLREQGLEAHSADDRLVRARDERVSRAEPDSTGAMLSRAPLEREDLAAAIDRHDPDALLVDINSYGAQVAAELSGLPRATTLPSLLPWRERGVPPYGIGLPPRRDPVGRLRDALLWPVVERVFGKAMLPGLNALRVQAGLAPYASPFDYVAAADRVLVLTGEPLEYPRTQTPEHVRLVGFAPWDPPSEQLAWLDEPGDPWVLVTCSTDYLGDEALATTAVEALAGLPVRVVVTLADAHGRLEIEQSERVRVERFVPHAQVLSRAAAVICPSGMGIVAKATAAGVPVVAVPFDRDQPEVARRVEQAGVGVVLRRKRLTADRLRAAVTEAMAMRVAPGTIDGVASAGRFADTAEELLGVRRTPAATPAVVPRGRGASHAGKRGVVARSSHRATLMGYCLPMRRENP